MEDREKQTLAFAALLEYAQIPLSERPQVMRGAALFLSRGWPNNHFTVSMAARAGGGLIPPVYEGIGSEGRYFQFKKTTVHNPKTTFRPALSPTELHPGFVETDPTTGHLVVLLTVQDPASRAR